MTSKKPAPARNKTSEMVEEFLRIGREEELNENLDKIFEKYLMMEKALQMQECPWTEDIFTPLTDDEMGKLLDAISMANVSGTPDRFSAHLMRIAWNCIKKDHEEALSFDPLSDA